MAWTDEQKQEVIAAYEAAEPTPENSMEIVAELAEEYEQSPNGVRIILARAGVYVKKDSASKAKSGGGTRVSKAAAQEALAAALEAAGEVADMEVIEKMTGKAAQYFTAVITSITE